MLIKQDDIYADYFWIDYLCSIASLQLVDVPIVACAVSQDQQLLATAVNATIANNDPCAHAEIELLRVMSQLHGNHRLPGITVYVNLEPCLMCYGALIQARIKRLVFGCADEKFGVLSKYDGLHKYGQLNHKIYWRGGVCSDKCALIIKNFFKVLRANKSFESKNL